NDPGRLWFNGHWGFQWYMEQGGATAIDVAALQAQPGDLIASARNNSNVPRARISPGAVEPLLQLRPVPCRFAATMQPGERAGFYTSLWGPLPYAFDLNVPPDDYDLVRLLVPMTRAKPASAESTR